MTATSKKTATQRRSAGCNIASFNIPKLGSSEVVSPGVKSSEITSETSYLNRRELLAKLGITGGSVALGINPFNVASAQDAQPKKLNEQALNYKKASPAKAAQGFYTPEDLTPDDVFSSYCNFYEFGTDKTDPKRYASRLTTSPWSITVEGEAENTGVFALEDIVKDSELVERIYRFRCVEAWSMVVPWVGIPLATVLKKFKPNSKAKYVAFETLYRPTEMRGQRSASAIIDWPYVEGLRMDEAMHPLSLLATGVYGKSIANQNGAPLRLVVPWKYGFKSIKSIVRIRFTEQQPSTSWNRLAPREYGFYSNVNPKVSHPRWSQASERRLPSSLWSPNRIKTQLFNGYAEQVASLYQGLDLNKHF